MQLNMTYLETPKGLLYLGLAIMEIVLVNYNIIAIMEIVLVN